MQHLLDFSGFVVLAAGMGWVVYTIRSNREDIDLLWEEAAEIDDRLDAIEDAHKWKVDIQDVRIERLEELVVWDKPSKPEARR